jgi:glycosyltransferase involved in cell wall biosynthesis
MTSASAEVGPSGKTLLLVINEAYFLLSHRREVVLAAQRAGYRVHVAAPSHHAWAPEAFKLEELEKIGCVVHVIPLSRRGMNPLTEARTFAALVSLYRRLRPDVVHHITIKPNLYGGLAARLTSVPAAVFAVAGLGELFTGKRLATRLARPFVARALRLALGHRNARVIVQNPEDRQRLIGDNLAAPDRIVIIRGSGVDLAQFRAQPEPDGTPVVLMAARLIWDKGIAEFVEAARLLKRRGIAARCVLVGGTHPTNPRAVPATTLRGWAVEGVVEWWGFQTDMTKVLPQAHIVCLPSMYGEGVPKVLLEAAGCARAVVASDIPGCREAVAQGTTGLLVRPGDSEALADALATLLADPARRVAMGMSGRRLVEADFDERKVAAQTLAVYSELAPWAGHSRA